MKPFPIPIIPMGPGTFDEEEHLEYLPMPKDMDTYKPPRLPEPEQLMERHAARAVLHQVLERLQNGEGQINVHHLDEPNLTMINQIMGEGEASALIYLQAQDQDQETSRSTSGVHLTSEQAVDGDVLRIQESIFAGVWRVIKLRDGVIVEDWIEIGAIPKGLYDIAQEDGIHPPTPWPHSSLPANVINAPSLLVEIKDQSQKYRSGKAVHVVNLTLLPVTPEDIGFLDYELGTGRVLILSRGYGNCRITNTRYPNTWRVVYYNSMEKVILNTVEIIDMPEVALAAPEDLQDSYDRLHDIVTYLESV